MTLQDCKQLIQDDILTCIDGIMGPWVGHEIYNHIKGDYDSLSTDLEDMKDAVCQIVVDRFNELDFGVVKPEPTDKDYINVIE